jgi:hypothetical protein
VKIAEGRGSYKKAEQRKNKEERAEMGPPEGTDIPGFFDRHSENERNDK